MQELYTQGWVLERMPVGEADEFVVMYTEEFGKIRARAKSIRKITSKVSSQLQPLGLSHIRLVRRNGPGSEFVVIDALADTKPQVHLMPIAKLLLNMTHEWERDERLWERLKKMISGTESIEHMQKEILDTLGFDATHAMCLFCKKTPVGAFVMKNHDFVCKECALKIKDTEVIYIL